MLPTPRHLQQASGSTGSGAGGDRNRNSNGSSHGAGYDAYRGDPAPYSPVDYNRPPPDPRGAPYGYHAVHTPHHAGAGPGLPVHPGQGLDPPRRPVSDPNELALGALRMSDGGGPGAGQGPPQGHDARRVSGGGGRAGEYDYAVPPPNGSSDSGHEFGRAAGSVGGLGPGMGAGAYRPSGAASVYSLDSGMGAYGQPQMQAQPMAPYPGLGPGQVYGAPGGYDAAPPGRMRGPSWDAAMGHGAPPPNQTGPHMAAANDYLNMMPPPGAANYPNGAPGPSASASPASIVRHASSASSLSLARTTTSVGSANARRKGAMAAVDVNKPPYTKKFVDDYRARMKGDPDPEAQFAFAKYLIEAARIVGDDMAITDPKMGRRYRDSLLAESLKNIKKFASGHDAYAEAQFFLANMYGTGQLGLAVDYEKAHQLYMQASKQNHPAATYRTAVCNELGAGTRKEPNRAVLFYRKAATLRDTAAMYKLGMVLLQGLLGQPRNPREGITWLRRAAQQADEDNPHSLHELAMLHENPTGLGVGQTVLQQSDDMARELYIQAAQLGYAPAQFKLGTCYEYGGLGCGIDPRRSIAWLSRAAEKGDPEAELALSGWFLTGAEGVLKQSDSEAYLWARRSGNKGLAKAEYAVGCGSCAVDFGWDSY